MSVGSVFSKVITSGVGITEKEENL